MALDVDLYLQRLGCARPAAPDLAALRAMHRAHQQTIAFENLDVVRGIPLSLEIEDLQAKVLGRGRGGFCYELNGLFAALLEELGYAVVRLAAGVTNAQGVRGPLFDHLTLEVGAAGAPGTWLCDVGFGRAFLEPLPLRESEDLSDTEDRFALRRTPVAATELTAHDGFGADGGVWTLLRHGPGDERANEDGWIELYRFDRAPRRIEDFRPMFLHHQSSPQSHFPTTWICTRAEEDGRVTVRDLEVTERRGSERSRWTLASAEARLEWIRERFGIELDDDRAT